MWSIGGIASLSCPSKFWEIVFQSPFCCGLWSVLATRPWVRRLGWLASGTLLYMWRALQFAGKMRRDKNTNTSSPSELRAATSRHVALSRPVTRVNAQMLTAICHRVFVIKWEGDVWLKCSVISFFFFVPISQRDTRMHRQILIAWNYLYILNKWPAKHLMGWLEIPNAYTALAAFK